ncbi:MAG: nitrogenase [Spirochaetes bacterium]|nr:nitrogenase [Spirochaetota bacterium]
MNKTEKKHEVTQNACKLCTPLGACLALKGIKGAITLLHGSQGCSTYIRRYMISHFREPIDIASSNFSEDTAIFGGNSNLKTALTNIIKQYNPEVIGIPTTCLSETIGDDVNMIIKEYISENEDENLPEFITVSTPSYKGTHIDGFHETVRSVVSAVSGHPGEKSVNNSRINIFPGMVSAEDIRHLKEIISDFGLDYIMLPDYSETLDGQLWTDYKNIPEGGTSIDKIREMDSSAASVEFGKSLDGTESASRILSERSAVNTFNTGLPIGINETDKFMNILSEISGRGIPEKYLSERGRLIDAYADAHKYIFGVKAALYGEEDLVIGLASFLSEIGIIPVLCASGGNSGRFSEILFKAVPDLSPDETSVYSDADFSDIEEQIKFLKPDLIIGNSKGYSISRSTDIPLIRTGFPIHDRIGGQRILHLGYRGAQQLFDKAVNSVIEKRQDSSPVGYSYM